MPKDDVFKDARENVESRFEPTQYNDVGFAIGFLAQLAIIVCWISYAAAAGKFQVVEGAANSGKTVALLQGIQHGVAEAPNQADSVQYLVILAALSLMVSVICAAIWMFLLKAFPVQMTKGSLLAFPVVMAAFLAYALATGSKNIFGIAIGTGLAALFTYLYWERAAFTAMIVKSVVQIYDKSSGVYAIGFLTIVLQATWMILIALSFVPLVLQGQGLLMFPLLLSMFWGMQVISNILYVAAAGVVARHYFGVQKEEATQKSFQQACTNYFGSICFGSLLIAIVQTLTEMCRKAQQQAEEDGNAASAVCACVAQCFLSCLESLIQMFNEFAFVYVAIYGIPFLKAAEKTFDLICSSSALVQDSIVNIVTICGSIAVAITCAMFNWLSAWRLSLGEGYRVGIAFLGFIIGFGIMCVVSRILEGGCTTMIVCFEEEPDKLDPELKASFFERKGLSKKPK